MPWAINVLIVPLVAVTISIVNVQSAVTDVTLSRAQKVLGLRFGQFTILGKSCQHSSDTIVAVSVVQLRSTSKSSEALRFCNQSNLKHVLCDLSYVLVPKVPKNDR